MQRRTTTNQTTTNQLALVTGATGFLGSYLVRHLLGEKIKVRCIKRATGKIGALSQFTEIEWVNGDITDAESILKASENVDVIFHCAAYVNLHSNINHATSRKINVDGTRNVIEAAKRCNVKRLVFCSSITAIAIATSFMESVTEESKFNLKELGLLNSYAATKKEAEDIVTQAVKNGEIDAVIANPSLILGGFDPEPMILQIIINCCKWQHIIVNGAMNVVDVNDCARGLILTWKKGKAGERYILGGHNVAIYDLCRLSNKLYRGYPNWFIFLPKFIAYPVGYFFEFLEHFGTKTYLATICNIKLAYASLTASSDKAITKLGYTITPLEDTVKEYLEFYKKAGMLS